MSGRTNNREAQECFKEEQKKMLSEIRKLRDSGQTKYSKEQLKELERILTTSTEYEDMFK